MMVTVSMAAANGYVRDEVEGVVDSFDADAGWGVIVSDFTPGGCFVHFSVIRMAGFKALERGQLVTFTFEKPGFLQDGYRYRAVMVTPR